MEEDKSLGFFSPFYEKRSRKTQLSFTLKLLFSLACGIAYDCLLLAFLNNKTLFYSHKLWLLGLIVGVALLALYLATAAFRRLLPSLCEMDSPTRHCRDVVKAKLKDNYFLGGGLLFACLNCLVGYSFGVPILYHTDLGTLTILYLGFALAGFVCGMAVWGVIAVVAVCNELALNLQQAIDYRDPDGSGGTGFLGNALVLFGVVTMVVGVLISLFITAMPWQRTAENEWVQLIMWGWIAFPYIVTATVVAVPAMAVGQQLSRYKFIKRRELTEKLRRLEADLQSNLDHEQRPIFKARVEELREDLSALHAMRVSPITRQTGYNFLAAIVPNLFGSSLAVTKLMTVIGIGFKA